MNRPHPDGFLLAASLILVSEFFLVLTGMVIKNLAGEIPTSEMVLARNFFGLLLLTPWLLSKGTRVLKTTHLKFHIMRAVVGVSAMSCLYYSWAHLPLAQAALLKQTAPFFIPIFGFIWLGEGVSWAGKLAIFAGFIGVMLILNPTDGAINVAVFIALTGAMLGAFAKIIIRRMSGSEPTAVIVFYFALFSSLFALIPAWINWVTPSLEQCMWLFLMAITSTVAQLLLSRGYGLAPAGQLGPYTYASVAFAALLGWWIWEEQLDLNDILGMIVILFAAIIGLKRTTRVLK